MYIFYKIITFIFPLAIMARVYKNKDNKTNLLLTLIIMSVFVLVAGLRGGIGDTQSYIHLYKLIVSGQYIHTVNAYEPGFIYFLQLLTYISTDPQVMIFITSLITNILNIITFRSYASYFELQTYMYITAGYYIASMNGIRQALVASVLFASTRLIIEGKFYMYLLIVIIMSTFHTSALIMIPIYFIARNEAWSKKTVLLIGVSSILLIAFQPAMGIIFKLLEGSKYGAYQDAINSEHNGGTNILRVVISAIPVVLSYLGRNKLETEWPNSNIFVNMSLINFIVMLFSTYSWLFARLNYYFQLYNFVLLPYCIKLLFNKKEKHLIYYTCVVCYFIYFWYDTQVMAINYWSSFINM